MSFSWMSIKPKNNYVNNQQLQLFSVPKFLITYCLFHLANVIQFEIVIIECKYNNKRHCKCNHNLKFSCFKVITYTLILNFCVCGCNNVLNILWEHLDKYEMNLISTNTQSYFQNNAMCTCDD
jgi:hypothetical protein